MTLWTTWKDIEEINRLWDNDAMMPWSTVTEGWYHKRINSAIIPALGSIQRFTSDLYSRSQLSITHLPDLSYSSSSWRLSRYGLLDIMTSKSDTDLHRTLPTTSQRRSKAPVPLPPRKPTRVSPRTPMPSWLLGRVLPSTRFLTRRMSSFMMWRRMFIRVSCFFSMAPFSGSYLSCDFSGLCLVSIFCRSFVWLLLIAILEAAKH